MREIRRMVFIPELRAAIYRQLGNFGFGDMEVSRALKLWDEGGQPRTFAERVCFDVFRQVEENVNKTH